MVNRQRIRNIATSSGACSFSSAFDTAANRAAISRVTCALLRAGSSATGSVHI
jgi:hypothetical protein